MSHFPALDNQFGADLGLTLSRPDQHLQAVEIIFQNFILAVWSFVIPALGWKANNAQWTRNRQHNIYTCTGTLAKTHLRAITIACLYLAYPPQPGVANPANPLNLYQIVQYLLKLEVGTVNLAYVLATVQPIAK